MEINQTSNQHPSPRSNQLQSRSDSIVHTYSQHRSSESHQIVQEDCPCNHIQNNNRSHNQHQNSPIRNETRPTSLPDLLPGHKDYQSVMKDRIRQIQRNKSITPKEKAQLMQKLMTHRWDKLQDGSRRTQCITASSDIEQERRNVTYNNKDESILGCKHYQRNCKLFAKCCNKWYTCRFCHDENEDHTFDRYGTEKISCMACHTVQNVSSTCINERCGIEFGKYFCDKCKFHDNDGTKDIYHCDKCNICRIGKGLGIDYFHCDKCNACMSITLKNHKCVENSLESNCPICHDYMFTSTTPVMFLPCGHCMHVSCYEEYTLTNYVCPICSKSLGDMKQYFKRIDELMEHESMPHEYENHRSLVFCSDCERNSTTKFHFVYHKCQYPDCGSYNTKIKQQFVVTSGEVIDRLDPSTPRAPALSTTLEFE